MPYSFCSRVSAAALALLLLSVAPTFAQCVGDCSGDGEVTIDEIITMVNIALGTSPLSTCSAGDSSSDGEVTVDEIVAAVNNSLASCPAVGTGLGTRHFVINPRTSPFTAVLSPGFSIPLGGGFRGQKDGVVGKAYMDMRAGEPNGEGVATIDVVDASDFFFVDANPTAPLVLCLKPLVPVTGAGAVQCNGGSDYSIALSVNHNIGQVGRNGFSAAQCLATSCGENPNCDALEGANQICARGVIGDECAAASDCDTTPGAGDGLCGLGRVCTHGRTGESCTKNSDCDPDETGGGICAPQPVCSAGKPGSECRSDADCDSTPSAEDGACGGTPAHPGVCNGPISNRQLGGDSGAGAVALAPVLGLKGLPARLSIERALPCGDEGPGITQPFALTSGATEATIRNFSNFANKCSDGSTCSMDSDCDAVDGGPGKGVCGEVLTYPSKGENFSCSDWTNENGPGCFTLSVPSLDLNPMGGDIITAFKFCGR